MGSKSQPTVVGAAQIRTAYRDGTLKASDVKDAKGNVVSDACLTGGPQGRGRGRVHPLFVAHYLANTKNTVYAEKTTTVKTITLPVTKTSAKGATLKRPVDVPLSEARRLAGVEGKMGRLSNADVEKAARAFEAERDAS